VRLMKLSEYRRHFYVPGSEPSLATLRKHITEIPGGIIMHGRYFVDLDKLARGTDLRAEALARERELAQDPILKGLV
jgi:hypothetical protein